MALDAPRQEEVRRVLRETDFVFTTRDVVVETFNAIQRRTRSSRIALDWWQALRAGRMRIYEPPLGEVLEFMERNVQDRLLSLVDCSLAHVARRERVQEIATEDGEFEHVGLRAIFARR